MQLDTISTQTKNACGQTIVQFVVIADGNAVCVFGTKSAAWAYQDKLWDVAQNKIMEALYAGR